LPQGKPFHVTQTKGLYQKEVTIRPPVLMQLKLNGHLVVETVSIV